MLTFNRNSWHFWLAYQCTSWAPTATKTNICSYFWAIVRGFLAMLCCVSVAFIVPFSIISAWIWLGFVLWFVYFEPTHLMTFPIQFGIVITIVCIAFPTFAWGMTKYDNWRYARYDKKPSPPGLIKSTWRNFKEKTCVWIYFQ